MSIFSVLNLTVYGDTYEDVFLNARTRIADFYELSEEDLDSKLNYEINIKENQEMASDFLYEAVVTVRGKNV